VEQHVAFLEALRSGTGGQTDWLVYADFLEDQGEPLADLIRLQLALASCSEPDPHWVEMARRERQLLTRHRQRWQRLSESLAPWPEAQRFLAERILSPQARDPDGFLCPTCGATAARRMGRLHPVTLHWALNPGLVVNEVLLGQRLPAVTFVCQHCGRPSTRCGDCRQFLSLAEPPFTRAFGNWFGFRCPRCDGRIPMTANLVAAPVLTAGRLLSGYGWLWRRKKSSPATNRILSETNLDGEENESL
jgi:uncharacterized protein (TIGR02996 family)